MPKCFFSGSIWVPFLIREDVPGVSGWEEATNLVQQAWKEMFTGLGRSRLYKGR